MSILPESLEQLRRVYDQTKAELHRLEKELGIAQPPMTTPADQARELAKRIGSGAGSYLQDEVDAIAQALTDAEARGRERGLEEAAEEAESWWEMFQFDTFADSDPRRFANPNQIAARIRALKRKGAG